MAEHQEGHANEKVAPEDTGSASDLYTERYTYIYIYTSVCYIPHLFKFLDVINLMAC